MRVGVHVWACVRLCVYMCVCVCMCVIVCDCVCLCGLVIIINKYHDILITVGSDHELVPGTKELVRAHELVPQDSTLTN